MIWHRLLNASTRAILNNRFLSRLYCGLFINPEKYRDVKVEDISMLFHVENSYINYYLTRILKSPEERTYSFLKEHIKDGDVFYDIGANIGYYVILLQRLRTLRQVVAFEPEALNFAELSRNIWANECSNAVALPVAIGDRCGYEEFYLQQFKAGNASSAMRDYDLSEPLDQSELFIRGYKQNVVVRTLDSIIEEMGLESPSVVLIDVDGGELPVLRGMTGALSNGALRAIAIEVAEETAEPTNRLLSEHGFSRIEERGRRRGNEFYLRESA